MTADATDRGVKRSRIGLRRDAVHAQIARVLRDELARTGVPGNRFPSQNEIAARFEVTPNTAREAVARLVQEGLLERRFGSGTFVTDRRVQRYVAVLTELDIAHPQVSPFFTTLVQRVRRRLAEDGFLTRLYIGHEPPYGDAPPPARITSEEFWADLEADRLMGLVLIGTHSSLGEAVAHDHGIPVANTGVANGQPVVDYAGLVRCGVRYLAEHGRRQVACLGLGAPGQPNALLDTFLAEVHRHGLSTRAAWVVGTQLTGSPVDGVDAFRNLWQSGKEKPNGLLVLDDILYRAIAPLLLFNRIRVPEDLTVVSHADSRDPRPLVPAPVSLDVDPYEVAEGVVRQIEARLRRETPSLEGIPVPIHVREPVPVALGLAVRQAKKRRSEP